MKTDKTSEAWRHECECRDWLRRGYTTKAKVDDLIRRVSSRRGREAGERLREGMREEYAKQHPSLKRHRRASERR